MPTGRRRTRSYSSSRTYLIFDLSLLKSFRDVGFIPLSFFIRILPTVYELKLVSPILRKAIDSLPEAFADLADLLANMDSYRNRRSNTSQFRERLRLAKIGKAMIRFLQKPRNKERHQLWLCMYRVVILNGVMDNLGKSPSLLPTMIATNEVAIVASFLAGFGSILMTIKPEDTNSGIIVRFAATLRFEIFPYFLWKIVRC